MFRLFGIILAGLTMSVVGLDGCTIDPARQASRESGFGRLISTTDIPRLSSTTESEIKKVAASMKRVKSGSCLIAYGASGTGKTIAARMLAIEIGNPLFRVDLAAVVSKYIGETEKNLSRVFDNAASNHWILFFDEADALFGRRMSVNDAHDRYANREVVHFAGRLQKHRGIVILATDSRENIRPAIQKQCRHKIKIQK